MWPASLLRVALIPMFMLCNLNFGGGSIVLWKPLFTQDYVPYILMAVLGLTNGYYGTLCMMYGPQVNSKECVPVL